MSQDYFHLRSGNHKSPSISLDQFRNFIADIYNSARDRGYLQEAIGYECVDSGVCAGVYGTTFASVALQMGAMNIGNNVTKDIKSMSMPELFGFLEILHDVISEGDKLSGYYHEYSQCGWHYKHFSKEPARAWLIQAVNRIIRFVENGYEMNGDGRIQLVLNDLPSPILDVEIPANSDRRVIDRVNSARSIFLSGRSTWNERRIAVREIGDVYELLRKDAKSLLNSQDERDIFNILNNFAIRHLNDEQKSEYDHILLTWLFYILLGGIHALLSLKERNIQSQTPGR